ncbi:hypothetical protein DAEQUDRAFT_700475 [Daedalea quercina L-15889]|uniref:Endoplasmic reticulum-based factor for assembly of V-ATPase n=1 Tax=Daedalea quercina L-15889 TaxID=1314783 RepID=A0A165KH86_9APHY|nr:hypothetical protein DAEQUDRAFT_700475 [Daedalea quercina L-15889]
MAMPSTSAMAIATSHTQQDLNVSLEPHLLDTLRPLVRLLPEDIASRLDALVASDVPPANIISHSLLSSISAWTRSSDGEEALASHNPPLRPADYSMIALLAGTRTSPERKFPEYVAHIEGADERKAYSDRRAMTNVLNALLSIGGAGFATWWAAGRLAWKDEWKVLLSLAVALVVAASEAVLYLIWDASRSERPCPRRRPARVMPPDSKKDTAEPVAVLDGPAGASRPEMPVSTAVAVTQGTAILRERAGTGRQE